MEGSDLGGTGTSLDRSDVVRASFDTFWAAYPKKVGKDAAWRAWRKRRPTSEISQQILAALTWQRTQDNWLREGGRFVPNPATWINEGRWQDEPAAIPRLNERSIALGRTGQEFLGLKS